MAQYRLFGLLAVLLVVPTSATAGMTGVAETRTWLEASRHELGLRVDFAEETISGSARVVLRNAGERPVREASFLLYRLMTVSAVRDDRGTSIPFRQDVVAFEDEPRKQVNHVRVALPTPLEPGANTSVEIEYAGYLAGYVETGSRYIKDRVDEEFTIIHEDAEAYPTVRVPSEAANRAAPSRSSTASRASRFPKPTSWPTVGRSSSGRSVIEGRCSSTATSNRPGA